MLSGSDPLKLEAKDAEVVLVFPGKYRSPNPHVPLSMLHVAYPLVDAGFKVRILDMRLEDYHNFKLGNPVFVGISAMSGLQIRFALEFAKKVRAENPKCPIVWGGVHPSLLPEQTLASDYVDIVVRGESEPVVAELAVRLVNELDLSTLRGITYKHNGETRINPDSDPIDMNSIPIDLPFNLLSLEKYPSFRSGRFHIQTSRGCPHKCGYCYNAMFNNQKWRCKTAKRVVDEIKHIQRNYPSIKIIDPIDDNFFVDRERVEDICEALITQKIQVTWRANCRFDYLPGYSKEFLSLIEKAGCNELDFGGETASNRLLRMIDKEMTSAEMISGVQKLKENAPSIKPFISWMAGLPTETEGDLKKLFVLMENLSSTNRNVQHTGVFVFTPFPSPLASKLTRDYPDLQSLEEWGAIDMFHFRPPWHPKMYVDRLYAISAVTRYAFHSQDRVREHGEIFRIGYRILNSLARLRWKTKWFGFPIDMWLTDLLSKRLRGWI